jgi:hypothetical protein
MVIVCCLSADEAKEDGRTGSDRRGGSGSGVARISHEELRGPVGGEGGDAARCSAIALTATCDVSRLTVSLNQTRSCSLQVLRCWGNATFGVCSRRGPAGNLAQLRRAD